MWTAVGAYGKGIKSAALHIKQLIAQYIANGTDFTLIAIALAQQSCAAEMAAIGKYRKIKRNKGKAVQLIYYVFNDLIAVEPDAQLILAGKLPALLLPQSQRHYGLRAA